MQGLTLKLILVGVVLSAFLAGRVYINKLKDDLVIAQENVTKLELSVKEQQAVISLRDSEIKQLKILGDTITAVAKEQQDQLKLLQDVFNTTKSGEKRDFGGLAVKKPVLIQNAVNNGTDKVNRCLEILTGSPLRNGESYEKCKISVNSIPNR